MTKKLLYILSLILILQLSTLPHGFDISENARAQSKSSGNEVMRDIQSGLDLTGKSKTDVLKLIGPPWQKDMTPVKARYNEKWTYSCEKKSGLTYDCVFIYFLADRVKKVEIY